MRKLLNILLGIAVLAVMTPAAQAGDILNYQGRLTDASGNPVEDGSQPVTFKIFNALTGGSQLWSDIFAVTTSSGLFSVQLGSQAPLDLATIDGNGNLYLEITIGASAPLAPRTLLTSAPRAAMAGRVIGGVETGTSSMLVKRADGDSSIAFNSSPDKASIYMFAPQPEPPGKALELSTNQNNGASIRMFAPQPEPPGLWFQLMTDPESGPSMGFFDDGSEVMGIEPSPFRSGFSIRMFAPQPEPPGRQLAELSVSYATNPSAKLALSGTPTGGSTIPLASMTADSSGGNLRIGYSTDPVNSGGLIKALSDAVQSRLDITGPASVGGPTQTIALLADQSVARVGIGTPSPTQALQVIGNICYTGTIGACSDEKYKRNVKELDNALDNVMRLRGVKYSWRTNEYPDMHFTNDRQVGFIAQEVKAVLPEAVTQQQDGSYVVDYTRVTPLLLEAVKELRGLVDHQESRIRELESQLDELRKESK